MRLTREQFEALLEKPGYRRASGERGPDKKPRKPGSGMKKTYPDYSKMLLAQMELAGLPAPKPEFKFHATRGWRIDAAYPDRLIAIEIEGAVHRLKDRFQRDMEKYQELFLAGWRLLRVSTAQVRSGAALRLVERALALPKPESHPAPSEILPG